MKIEDVDTGPLCDACSARLDRDGPIKHEHLCARCAAKLNIPAMTPKLTDSSAELLSFMAAIPNGHIVIMHNASTPTMTLLGKK
jgi:predicted amidophosphoribosyltransferase